MNNTNRRPAETADAITARLIARLTERGDKNIAWSLDELTGAVENLSAIAVFADSTRRRGQVVDAFTDAQTACLAALGRLVAQIDADLDAEDKEGREAVEGDAHATGDVLTEVRQ